MPIFKFGDLQNMFYKIFLQLFLSANITRSIPVNPEWPELFLKAEIE